MKKKISKQSLFIIILSILNSCCYGNVSSGHKSNEENSFYEELVIRPLASGHIYSHFEFTTLWKTPEIEESIVNYKDFEFIHYNLFPRALGEIIERYHVRELHLSLTQGLWRYQKWGYPVVEAPPGAQLWAWFNPNVTNLDQTWKDLVNALSGLFCASLNFIDSTNTVSPKLSFRPLGLSDEWYHSNSSYMRYTALPRENVCTENLTPWKKLLPCDTKSGLSTLLHPTPLYSSHFHSLSLHLRPTCKGEACSEPVLELVQSLSLVQKILHDMEGKQDWTLRRLFSAPLISVCPLAQLSKVYVDITGNEDMEMFSLHPPPSVIEVDGVESARRVYAIYDTLEILREEPFNLQARYPSKHIYGYIPPPVLQASRYITGHGQERGSITIKLTNSGPEPLSVVYLEVLPWYLRLFFHPSHSQQMKDSIYVSKLVTARDRERGWLYEVVVKVPPRSTIELKLEFNRALLKWLEYPPDANHGFYIPAAIFSAMLPTARNVSVNRLQATGLKERLKLANDRSFVRIVSETLLVSLLTPDFSMPYNVICLACTVVALAFGPIHNITTKRLTMRKLEGKSFPGKNLLTKIKDESKRKWDNLKSKWRRRNSIKNDVEPSNDVIHDKDLSNDVIDDGDPSSDVTNEYKEPSKEKFDGNLLGEDQFKKYSGITHNEDMNLINHHKFAGVGTETPLIGHCKSNDCIPEIPKEPSLHGSELQLELFALMNNMKIAFDIDTLNNNEEKQFYLQNVAVPLETSKYIEQNTRFQSKTSFWFEQRQCRITASNFGKFCKLKSTTDPFKTFERTKVFFTSKSVEHGMCYESQAIAKFLEGKSFRESPVGLVVNPQVPFLGASPDQIIHDGTSLKLIEVKCPFSLFEKKLKISQVINDKSFYLERNETGDLCLTKNHDYYYQIQGQLNITGVNTCILLVYVPPSDLVTVTIERDEQYFLTNMLPKLCKVYFRHLLPNFIKQARDITTKC